MIDFTSIPEWELQLIHFLAPVMAIFLAVLVSLTSYSVLSNVAGYILFRIKGYATHDIIVIDGHYATITKIGFLSTHFKIVNGTDVEKYLTVSNSRLDFLTVYRLVDIEAIRKQVGG